MGRSFLIHAGLSEASFKAARDIDKFSAEKQEGIRRVIAEGTRAVHRAALNKAPYAKGTLKSRITYEIKGSYGKVVSSAPHSHMVEHGTDERITYTKRKQALKINKGFAKGDIYNGKMAKKPFMRPAIEQERPKIEAGMEALLK